MNVAVEHEHETRHEAGRQDDTVRRARHHTTAHEEDDQTNEPLSYVVKGLQACNRWVFATPYSALVSDSVCRLWRFGNDRYTIRLAASTSVSMLIYTCAYWHNISCDIC